MREERECRQNPSGSGLAIHTMQVTVQTRRKQFYTGPTKRCSEGACGGRGLDLTTIVIFKPRSLVRTSHGLSDSLPKFIVLEFKSIGVGLLSSNFGSSSYCLDKCQRYNCACANQRRANNQRHNHMEKRQRLE